MPDTTMPRDLADIIKIHREMFGGFTMMADEGEATEGGKTSGETPAAKQFEPINSQDDLNRVIAERIQRERAKFADYDDLKTKASRFDELDQKNKSELEKATERAAALEAERDAQRSAALRWRVAAKHGITDEDAELYLTGLDEETLTRQAARLADLQQQKPKVGLRIDHTGRQPAPTEDRDSAAREFFGL